MFNDKAWAFISLGAKDFLDLGKGKERDQQPICTPLYNDGLSVAVFYGCSDDDGMYGDVEGYYFREHQEEFFINFSDNDPKFWRNGKVINVERHVAEELKEHIPDGRQLTVDEHAAQIRRFREAYSSRYM